MMASTSTPKEITLKDIKPLTNTQYDQCRQEAVERVRTKVGDRPQRKDFERELEPLWHPLDFIALLVGLSAWAVSSVHILTHAGRMAAESFSRTVSAVEIAGAQIEQAAYGGVHQVGFIVLAESAMILFMVMHSSREIVQRQKGEQAIPFWLRRSVSIPLLLALMTALFVIVANWQSGVGPLESILPPAVTIGLGIYFERLISETLRRRKDVTARYLEAMRLYEAAQKDIESHPDFHAVFPAGDRAEADVPEAAEGLRECADCGDEAGGGSGDVPGPLVV